MLHAIEPKQHPFDHHLSQPLIDDVARGRDRNEAVHQSLDNTVYVRKRDLLFTREMKVNTALADADFGCKIVDRHLLIAVFREQPVCRVENGIARRSGLNGISHVMTSDWNDVLVIILDAGDAERFQKYFQGTSSAARLEENSTLN